MGVFPIFLECNGHLISCNVLLLLPLCQPVSYNSTILQLQSYSLLLIDHWHSTALLASVLETIYPIWIFFSFFLFPSYPSPNLRVHWATTSVPQPCSNSRGCTTARKAGSNNKAFVSRYEVICITSYSLLTGLSKIYEEDSKFSLYKYPWSNEPTYALWTTQVSRAGSHFIHARRETASCCPPVHCAPLAGVYLLRSLISLDSNIVSMPNNILLGTRFITFRLCAESWYDMQTKSYHPIFRLGIFLLQHFICNCVCEGQ